MKCFSFYYGTSDVLRSNWMLMDLKIPAPSAKAALTMFFVYYTLMRSHGTKEFGKIEVTKPSKQWVESFVMRMIEYDKVLTPKYGYTRHTYKKKRSYGRSEIAKMI